MRIGSGIASQMARFPKGSSHDWVKRVDNMPGRLPKSRLDSVLVNHAGRPESRPLRLQAAWPSPAQVESSGRNRWGTAAQHERVLAGPNRLGHGGNMFLPAVVYWGPY